MLAHSRSRPGSHRASSCGHRPALGSHPGRAGCAPLVSVPGLTFGPTPAALQNGGTHDRARSPYLLFREHAGTTSWPVFDPDARGLTVVAFTHPDHAARFLARFRMGPDWKALPFDSPIVRGWLR